MGKPKKVIFELIKPEDVYLSGQPYELLAEIRAEQHFDLADAKVGLAWRKGGEMIGSAIPGAPN